MKTLKQNIINSLLKIPKTKITTYGEVARFHKTSPRAVASILRSNKEPKKYPCYKVVMSSGRIGGYCGSDLKNIRKKIAFLKRDGIVIKNNKIELKKYIHRF